MFSSYLKISFTCRGVFQIPQNHVFDFFEKPVYMYFSYLKRCDTLLSSYLKNKKKDKAIPVKGESLSLFELSLHL